MKRIGNTLVVFLSLVFLITGCKSAQINRTITKKLDSRFFENQFTGFLVYDPATNDTLINYNASKYFTPASNTKLVTFYTALHYLPDSIPAFRYRVDGDTISIKGTGDPTFLHPYFKDSTALKFIAAYKKVKLVTNNLSDYRYGPGWSWDDFNEHYSPERTSFPMYGNVITISYPDSLICYPESLRTYVHLKKNNLRRAYNKNEFYYPENRTKPIEIPMVMDSLLIVNLWDSLAPGKVSLISQAPRMTQTAYSVPLDSVLKRMLYVSDNFLAEQLLIMASSGRAYQLSSYWMRQRVLHHELADLKQEPRWVDGSGLSRYNLFTPTDFVQILTKLYRELPRERLFNLLPAGGVSGTLKYWYPGNPQPYIYAKSGSLSNNYSLSGYLITNKGKVLIFSFMNNHYKTKTALLKKQMQSIFEYLRDTY